jgi:isopentenyl phosphate kinase
MKELTVLKIGGSLITDKSSETPKVNYENLRRLSKEIASAYKEKAMHLIIVHGAGSYGHPIVKRTGIDKGIKAESQLKDFAEAQRLQNELNCIVTKHLIEEGVPAFPYQPSASAIMESGRLVVMDTYAIEGLMDIGMVPVLYGVPALDKAQGCSILSGDQIAPYLAARLGAKRIVHATVEDGVFTADPNLSPGAKLIPEINHSNINHVREWLTGSMTTDVTGGMFGKVSELLDIGIESQIVNGTKENVLKRALLGENVMGTVIKPDA